MKLLGHHVQRSVDHVNVDTWTVKGGIKFTQAFRPSSTIYGGKFKTRSELWTARCVESDFANP